MVGRSTISGGTSIATAETRTVPFLDLTRQHRRLASEVEAAIRRVTERGLFVAGPEVSAFEEEFAGYVGCRFAVGVGSGTEALHVALRACGAGPGDEVITVSHTAVATVAAIDLAGARPVLVDVDPRTCTLEPAALERAISSRTRAIIPVHLYGTPADMSPILATASRRGVRVVEDCAQAHGARYAGRRVGTLGDLGCFSFYPTKNLGALGDGGMVTTDDPVLAERVRLLRQYGWRERHVSAIKGFNSRLDEIQAAVLRVKLPHLDAWNARRRQLAACYIGALGGGLRPIATPVGAESVYHLFVVQTDRRDDFRRSLADAGIGTLIHYPVPVHLQEAYRDLGHGPGAFPASEATARSVVSLPLYPDMTDEEATAVISALARWSRA